MPSDVKPDARGTSGNAVPFQHAPRFRLEWQPNAGGDWLTEEYDDLSVPLYVIDGEMSVARGWQAAKLYLVDTVRGDVLLKTSYRKPDNAAHDHRS